MTDQIRNHQEYEAAVVEIRRLIDLDPPEFSVHWQRLKLLATAAEAYECAAKEAYQRGLEDAAVFVEQQKGMGRRTLGKLLRSYRAHLAAGIRALTP